MNKTNTILLALLLVQGACIGVQQLGGDAEDAQFARGMLLEGLEPDAVTKVVIEESGEGDDKAVTLEKRGDGWVVAERWAAPADADKLDELLRELAALEVADVVSTTGLHAVELGVADDDFRKKVTLSTGGGERVLYLGTTGRGSSTHARLGGEDEVVAVRNFSTWRVASRPDGWVDRLVVDVPPEDVTRLELAGPDGILTFTRTEGEIEGAAEWLMSDGARQAGLTSDDLDEILGKASKVTASKVLGELEAVEDELLRVTLTTDEGDIAWVVGASEEENNHLLARDDGAHLMQVGQWAVKPLLEADFDDLVPADAGGEDAPSP